VVLLLLSGSLSGCMGSVDEDVDGVSDELDLCTLTPIDEVVDENGCSASQKDGDGDDVSDADDLCAQTPIGEDADESGCSATERDGDGDGLVDSADSCPSSPASETVASDGCADSEVDMSMRPWWCHSTGTGHGDDQGHGDHLAPAYHEMTKGMLSWQDCIDVSEQFEA
ncbi:uncharacterized protein METZ01_LOCUS326701, partial [marine metagenome]